MTCLQFIGIASLGNRLAIIRFAVPKHAVNAGPELAVEQAAYHFFAMIENEQSHPLPPRKRKANLREFVKGIGNVLFEAALIGAPGNFAKLRVSNSFFIHFYELSKRMRYFFCLAEKR